MPLPFSDRTGLLFFPVRGTLKKNFHTGGTL